MRTGRGRTFDPLGDLLPIAPLLSYYNVLVINKDLPFRNLPELIDYAKANPGKVSYASPGNGSPHHLAMELFKQKGGIEWLKKAGLKSVRFEVTIFPGDDLTHELRDSIMEWIGREEDETGPCKGSKKRKRTA